MKKMKPFKNLFIISGLFIALIGSNFLWYKIYNREIKRVKNSLIPPLTNDYYSNQLILTNNIKRYEKNGYIYEFPNIENPQVIEDKYSYLNKKEIYDVPLINQLPKYPNGCEGASSVMLLNFYGVNITLEEFFKYLDQDKIYTENGTRFGPNPALFYAGDPTSNTGGWGCFDLVIAKAINKILTEKDYEFTANLKNNKEPLKNLAYNGPCLIWVTIDYDAVKEVFTWTSYDKKETYTYPKDEHVVVLTGYDEDYYYINDPLKNEKNIKVKKAQLEKSYDSLGRQSVAINLNYKKLINNTLDKEE